MVLHELNARHCPGEKEPQGLKVKSAAESRWKTVLFVPWVHNKKSGVEHEEVAPKQADSPSAKKPNGGWSEDEMAVARVEGCDPEAPYGLASDFVLKIAACLYVAQTSQF